MRRRSGVTLRQARGTGPDRFAGCVDARTRAIGVSYVSYLTGERHDLSALRALADSVGALLVVDFTQAAGYLPLEATLTDFAFSACYKWLLGVTGVAVAYWNRVRQPGGLPLPPDGIPSSLDPAATTTRRCSGKTRYASPAAIPLTLRSTYWRMRWTIWRPATCATFRRTSRA
jgi:selenocysteine lyase/cysteine desulfurase